MKKLTMQKGNSFWPEPRKPRKESKLTSRLKEGQSNSVPTSNLSRTVSIFRATLKSRTRVTDVSHPCLITRIGAGEGRELLGPPHRTPERVPSQNFGNHREKPSQMDGQTRQAAHA